MHPDDGQTVIVEPLDQLVPVPIEQPTGLTPPVGAIRPHLLHHLTQQHIGQPVLVAGPIHSELLGSLHVAADRLTVHPNQAADRPQPLTPQLQPQNFPHFEHANLPEHHAASCGLVDKGRRQAQRQRHRNRRTPQGGPITGERVVPSLATRRSHPTGETHTKVVPSHWRATPPIFHGAGRRMSSAMPPLVEAAGRHPER